MYLHLKREGGKFCFQSSFFLSDLNNTHQKKNVKRIKTEELLEEKILNKDKDKDKRREGQNIDIETLNV